VSIPGRHVQNATPLAYRDESSESLNVLVVDDLSDVRDSLCEVTRHLGHACQVGGSATEARSLLASTQFDAVLIDLQMPDADGRALAEEM
jgi:CheY-like chemotaxis protein